MVELIGSILSWVTQIINFVMTREILGYQFSVIYLTIFIIGFGFYFLFILSDKARKGGGKNGKDK